MKKICTLLLLFTILLSATAEEIPNDEIWYEASAKLTETTAYFNSGLHTNAFNTSIASHTFSGGKGIIKFNADVTSIGSYAFSGCSGLTSVTIGSSVESIGEGTFYECSGLKSITISKSVTSIGDWAFADCSGLTSITIPNSVTSIGEGAFYGCSGITSITIPDSVTSIGENAFSGCSNVKELIFAEGTTTILRTYLTSITSVTIPNSVTSIGENAFRDCSKLSSISIPDSVTSIGYYAFYNCTGLTSITIPNSVKSIGDSAFDGCSNVKELIYAEGTTTLLRTYLTSITSVTIPNSVTSIGPGAFSNCSGLTSITIPNSVKSIGENAFSGCTGLTSITIPNSVKSIENSAFSGCSNVKELIYAEGTQNILRTDLTSISTVTIPISAKNIGNGAFYGCSKLKSVTIPDSVTSIGGDAFDDCTSLISVTLPNALKSIGAWAFSRCSSMESIQLPNSITNIGNGAFDACSNLTTINIPDSLKSIGYAVFATCPKLESIIIPSSVNNIGAHAFMNSRINSITIPNSVEDIGQWAFYNCGTNEVNIIIEDFANKNIIPENIGWKTLNYIYKNQKIEEDFAFPGRIESIGYKALYKCQAITSVTIPESVKTIGESAFGDCANLTSITLSDSIVSIGNSAFCGCLGITSIAIPNHVKSIGSSAFSGCTGLKSIIIPNSVTSIGSSAFSGCPSLSSVKVNWNRPLDIESTTFSGIDFTACILYVPKGTATMYMVAPEWIKFKNIVEFGGKVESVSLNKSSLNLIVGNNETLTANVLPNDAEDKTLTWKSSNTEAATVVDGVVTGVGAGTAIITATTSDGSGLSANCTVNVVASNFIAVDKSGKTINKNVTPTNDLNIKDSFKSLAIYEDVEDVYISYIRNFTTSGNWQAWFVPFDVHYSDISGDYDVARILGVLTDDSGKPYIAFGKMTDGVVKGNVPYVVKAKLSGDITTETTSTLLSTIGVSQYAAQSMLSSFTFGGVYEQTTNDDKGWYALNNDGNFQLMGEEVYLKPFRIWMTITPREDSPYGNAVNPSEVKMMVIGDDPTGIDERRVMSDNSGILPTGKMFNLQGMEVSSIKAGNIYIISGKKYLAR